MAELARRESPLLSPLVDGFASDGDPLAAWDRFIRRHFRYREEWNEVIRAPLAMLEDLELRGYLEGDCDCVSTFFGAGARALGYEGRFVAIKTEPGEDYGHVYTEIFDAGRYRRFDATVSPDVVPLEVNYGELHQFF